MKVLLIEDDDVLRKIMMGRFEREGFEVVVAPDGETAIFMAKKERPDVILLDLILPKLNGFQVLEKLKEDKEAAPAPIIVLSNLGKEEDKETADRLGVKAYLIKTEHSLEEIVAKIREVHDHA